MLAGVHRGVRFSPSDISVRHIVGNNSETEEPKNLLDITHGAKPRTRFLRYQWTFPQATFAASLVAALAAPRPAARGHEGGGGVRQRATTLKAPPHQHTRSWKHELGSRHAKEEELPSS